MTKKMGIKFGSLVEDFDPRDLDIEQIKNYSSLIPRDGVIDLSVAEVLATQFLAASDYVSELLPRATRLTAKLEAEVKAERSSAISRIKGPITLAKALGDQDTKLLAKIDEYVTAAALAEYLKEKLELFVRAHYFCKDLLRRFTGVEGASSWNYYPEEDHVSEVDKTSRKIPKIKKKDLENETW